MISRCVRIWPEHVLLYRLRRCALLGFISLSKCFLMLANETMYFCRSWIGPVFFWGEPFKIIWMVVWPRGLFFHWSIDRLKFNMKTRRPCTHHTSVTGFIRKPDPLRDAQRGSPGVMHQIMHRHIPVFEIARISLVSWKTQVQRV